MPRRTDSQALDTAPGRVGHRAWRIWGVLLLGLIGLFWQTGPAMADTAGAQALQALSTDCEPGTAPAADLDADRGELADLDFLWALPRTLSTACLLQRFDLHTPLVVFGVQPWLPPPRRQG